MDGRGHINTAHCERLLKKTKVMPFGLTGAPSSFQQLMESVFQGLPLYFQILFMHQCVIFQLVGKQWEMLGAGSYSFT